MTNIQNISLDEPAVLIADDGTRSEVLCSERPIQAAEFFKCQQAGIENVRQIVINSDEYENQMHAEFGGMEYAVYRVYKRYDGYTEMYLSERIGV